MVVLLVGLMASMTVVGLVASLVALKAVQKDGKMADDLELLRVVPKVALLVDPKVDWLDLDQFELFVEKTTSHQ